MNTNSNVYTVIYTTVVCVMVAAILAFASQTLKPKQEANEKAETVSQILTAAQFGEKDHWNSIGNDATLSYYKDNIDEAILVGADGSQVGSLDASKVQIYNTSDLKAQNYGVKDGTEVKLPVYKFKDGTVVIALYGAGLWGPVWGYVALEGDYQTIKGAYFDHASETPGLGGKIKDDPAFRAQFCGKSIDWTDVKPFDIVKGGAPQGKRNAIDAISGASMTSKGVDAALNDWLGAYKGYLSLVNVPMPIDEAAATDTVAVANTMANENSNQEDQSNEQS